MTFQIKKKNILRITFLKNLTDFRSGIARKVRFCYTGFVAICIWNLTSFEPMALLSPGYQSIIPSSTLSDGTYQQIPLELTQCKSYIGLPFFFFSFLFFFSPKWCFIIFGERLFFSWFQAATCSALLWRQEQRRVKPEHRQKATVLQWLSPSHLIKFCTGLPSCNLSNLKHLKQWSRILCSLHFCFYIGDSIKMVPHGQPRGTKTFGLS